MTSQISWLQKLINAIDFKTPQWLKDLMKQLQDLIVSILMQVGKAYIQYLETAIIEAAEHPDWSNDQKFQYVFDKAKAGFVEFAITLKDSEINALIEQLVLLLKRNGAIA